LLHLEAETAEQEINLYINCEGGDLPSMLAVYGAGTASGRHHRGGLLGRLIARPHAASASVTGPDAREMAVACWRRKSPAT